MSARVSVRDLRRMLWIPGVMACLMLVLSVLVGEARLLGGFAALGMTCLLLERALRRIPARCSRQDFTPGETMATVALAWAVVCGLGAIPLLASGWLVPDGSKAALFRQPVNALFESVSGFTSTGLSMVDRPSQLPLALQFWRSLMEWVGGIGIALTMITLIEPAADSGDLFDAELNKEFSGDARTTALRIWGIYAVFTAGSVALFLALGMPPWQSLNHGMTAIATGGFSTTDDSFGGYAPRLQVAAIAITVIGAISFSAWHAAWVGRNLLVPLRRGPTLFLLGGIVVASGLLWALQSRPDGSGAWLDRVFQVVSAFGTAGFSTVDLSGWQAPALALLTVCMLIGGASGATTGGVKTDRILLLCRAVGWRLRRLFHGQAQAQVRIGTQAMGDVQARLRAEGAAALLALWLLTMLAGGLLLASALGPEVALARVGFEVTSALGSVGLSSGITQVDMPASGKWILMTLMWAGRLELIAVAALLGLPFVRKRVAT